MKIHTVLILAGGDGDRFLPLEHKMQFRFNGKTVLNQIVTSIAEFTEHIVVVTNRANKILIEEDLSEYAIQFAVQANDEGGMAAAILAAEPYLEKDTLVLNANDMLDFSIIPELVSKTIKEGSQMGIVAKHLKTYFPGGYVVFKDGKATGVIEKPSPETIPSEYVRFVVDYFPHVKIYIDELKKMERSDDQYEGAMSALMSNKPATCLKYEGDWATLKYSWHVFSMQEYFFSHTLQKSIDPSVTIHKTASIEGDVYIGKNVKIGAYCKITGPCYIGDNVVIGDHSLIRNSTVEENALIGSGCEVARSYLAKGVMLHRNYVGDSVLSEGVSMGAGTVTANYRFDAQTIKTPIKGTLIDSKKEKFGLIAGVGVKLGINVSTYPGVKLSAKTMVLPGEIVMRDR
jgi:bifunctional UDP-N-acetylglucosamine pyrophosphorylase/glucosamine-1-phosphate N-acetyltransferase